MCICFKTRSIYLGKAQISFICLFSLYCFFIYTCVLFQHNNMFIKCTLT